jgi:galactokinase
MDDRSSVERAVRLFENTWNEHPTVVATAPGRVNLIGEHTDYNDGFVLPMAIDRRTTVTALRGDGEGSGADLVAESQGATVHIDGPPWVQSNNTPWTNYPIGTIAGVEAHTNSSVGALRLAVASDVPMGAGLSSSAALEAATARAVLKMLEFDLPDPTVAEICQQAEHNFAGVRCGIMDQMSSIIGDAIMLDCRSYSVRRVKIPQEVAVVILDSGIPRGLTQSGYNERRDQCESGVAYMKEQWPDISALRDVTTEMLESSRDLLPETVYRRCRHVVTENARVLDGADALERGDVSSFGQLMAASHASMRDNYEISLPEMDYLVQQASDAEGCFGARLTGAGFGGAVVALVERNRVESLSADVIADYNNETGRTGSALPVSTDDGARIEIGV